MKYFEALQNDAKTACTQHFLQSKYFVRAWERTEWVDMKGKRYVITHVAQ